jgi:hypothetical protein
MRNTQTQTVVDCFEVMAGAATNTKATTQTMAAQSFVDVGTGTIAG